MTSNDHLVKGSYIPKLGKHFVLYSNAICPYSHRVHLVLNAKHLPYQSIYINEFNKPNWFSQKSPLGCVPVLEIFDKIGPVLDSLIIVEYLEDKFPERKLYARDSYQKACDKILILKFKSVVSSVTKVMNDRYDKHTMKELLEGLHQLEKELQKRNTSFFGGTKPGFVDYMIWPWIERMMFFPKIHPRFVLDVKYFGRFLNWRHQMLQNTIVLSCYMPPEYWFELHQRLKKNEVTNDFLNIASHNRTLNPMQR